MLPPLLLVHSPSRSSARHRVSLPLGRLVLSRRLLSRLGSHALRRLRPLCCFMPEDRLARVRALEERDELESFPCRDGEAVSDLHYGGKTWELSALSPSTDTAVAKLQPLNITHQDKVSVDALLLRIVDEVLAVPCKDLRRRTDTSSERATSASAGPYTYLESLVIRRLALDRHGAGLGHLARPDDHPLELEALWQRVLRVGRGLGRPTLPPRLLGRSWELGLGRQCRLDLGGSEAQGWKSRGEEGSAGAWGSDWSRERAQRREECSDRHVESAVCCWEALLVSLRPRRPARTDEVESELCRAAGSAGSRWERQGCSIAHLAASGQSKHPV